MAKWATFSIEVLVGNNLVYMRFDNRLLLKCWLKTSLIHLDSKKKFRPFRPGFGGSLDGHSTKTSNCRKLGSILVVMSTYLVNLVAFGKRNCLVGKDWFAGYRVLPSFVKCYAASHDSQNMLKSTYHRLEGEVNNSCLSWKLCPAVPLDTLETLSQRAGQLTGGQIYCRVNMQLKQGEQTGIMETQHQGRLEEWNRSY